MTVLRRLTARNDKKSSSESTATMPDWDDLKYALALSRHGRMNAAAQSLGVNVATMSRRIERLSELLGQPPFVKKADGWEASPAIGELLGLAEDIEQRLQSELNSISSGTAGKTLGLSIGCPPIVSLFVLYPNLQNRDPILENVNFSFSQRVMEDGLGDNDVVLQYKRPDSGRVITQKIASLTSSVYRRRSVGEDHGWASLGEQYDPTPFNQAAYKYFGTRPSMRVQSMHELYELVCTTDLAAPMLDIVARKNCELAILPGGDRFIEIDLWLIYHASRKGDPVIESTVSWFRDSFARVLDTKSSVVNFRSA